MLSRIYSSIILGINILIGLVLLCFNAEFYHNPSWIITIEQEQKYLLNWNMAFALIIIFYNLILLLLVDSLLLSKRPHLFFTYGLICSVCLLAIHLTNTILFVFVSKIKDENIDETSNNIAQVQSTSTTVSSTSSNTQTKMDDTTEQQSESSMKREK
ncbi:unnamed protein product [Rotaria sp. Silwood1]|nr:unnamed protein product [Rotaria sp. Silwood1]